MTETSPIPGYDAAESNLEPIDSVLLRAAKEAYLLHAELALLEREISQALTANKTANFNGLQRVDSARQTIEGLSRFLSRLAVTVDAAGNCDPIEAARTLTLQAQAKRLASVSSNFPPPAEPEPEVW